MPGAQRARHPDQGAGLGPQDSCESSGHTQHQAGPGQAESCPGCKHKHCWAHTTTQTGTFHTTHTGQQLTINRIKQHNVLSGARVWAGSDPQPLPGREVCVERQGRDGRNQNKHQGLLTSVWWHNRLLSLWKHTYIQFKVTTVLTFIFLIYFSRKRLSSLQSVKLPWLISKVHLQHLMKTWTRPLFQVGFF